MSDFSQKLSICMGKKIKERGVGGWGLGDCTVWVGAKDNIIWLREEESDMGR